MQILKCAFGISRISFIQLQFSRINLSDHSFKVKIFKRSSKYLEVKLKASIISASVSSERDIIKSLSWQSSSGHGTQAVIQTHKSVNE